MAVIGEARGEKLGEAERIVARRVKSEIFVKMKWMWRAQAAPAEEEIKAPIKKTAHYFIICWTMERGLFRLRAITY